MKKLISALVILLASVANSNVESSFCLDIDGFVYPIFESPSCEEENHERISKKEFSYIIDFEKKLSGKSIEGMNFAVHFSEVQDFLNN